MKLSSRKQLLEEADRMLSSFRKKTESASLKKELVMETVKLLYKLKRHSLNEGGVESSDTLDKSLANLKQLAIRAQRKWEKEQMKMNEDDPKKDYGKYKIKNPESKYALRNLPPTDDPEELEKRKIQATFERLIKKAPSHFLEAWAYRGADTMKDASGYTYSSKTGRRWTYEEEYLDRDFTPEEWERYQRGEGYLITKGKIPWGWIVGLLSVIAKIIWAGI